MYVQRDDGETGDDLLISSENQLVIIAGGITRERQ